MPRGGYRPGAGRKSKNTLAKIEKAAVAEARKSVARVSLEVAERDLKTGKVTPLEVLVENMRFYWAKRDQRQGGAKFRAMAQAAAQAAAQYMHPRLNSVDVGGKEGNPIELAFKDAKPALAGKLARLLNGHVLAANHGGELEEPAAEPAAAVSGKSN